MPTGPGWFNLVNTGPSPWVCMDSAIAAKPQPRPPAAPPCHALGSQCRGVPVILRVGALEEGNTSLDHESTWLIGHTQHITFYDIWEDEGELYVDAMLHVPCRYLHRHGVTARCSAYGFSGLTPRGPRREVQPRRTGQDRFVIVENRRKAVRRLPPPVRS